MRIELRVNGTERQIEVSPLARLLDVIRGELDLTGTKEGCGEGECGACSVLLEGEVVNACLVPVGQVHGREVITIEGIAGADGTLTRLQTALLEHGAAQCGICTPGMVVAGHAASSDLRGLQGADLQKGVREKLAGNLCRCTGYQALVAAVAASLGDEP